MAGAQPEELTPERLRGPGSAIDEQRLPLRRAWPGVTHTAVVRETVATNLRSARKRAGLSQSALAQHAGVDKRTISRIERAKADTGLSRLYAVALALSIPMADLLAGLPEP
jgi:DNA-binding XRE family transcriptional regulator